MISGRTRVAAVIGNPIDHSLSPRLHNSAFVETGLDWVYVAFQVDSGSAAVEAMRTLGLAGLSVTMPLKQEVAAAADEQTEAVARLGSANTLFWRDDKIWADSTDGDGFVAAYEHEFGRSLAGRRVGVLGAGGAACSIVEASARGGAEAILVVNRSRENALGVAEISDRCFVAEAAALAEVDVIVNATSVGMKGGPAPEQLPLPSDVLGPNHDVVDIVYNPRRTPLLTVAEQNGARISGGLGMLIHQAGLQFERWTGVEAPLEHMRETVLSNNS